jgi:hypothetical protein
VIKINSGTQTQINQARVRTSCPSTQVAFYQPEQSIVENLFKLQIGGSKHWNIYAHSFLQYGRDSAQSRMWSNLAQKAGCFDGDDDDESKEGHKENRASVCRIEDACLAVGASTLPVNSVTGEAGVAYPLAYHPLLPSALAVGKAHGVEPLGATPGGGNGRRSTTDDDGAAQQGNTAVQAAEARWDACLAQLVLPLGFNKLVDPADTWCLYSHLGQCSFAGVYQPSLPDAFTDSNGDGSYGNFVLIGGYVKLFKKLGLPLGIGSRVTLRQVQARGAEVCAMDKVQLETEFGTWPEDDADQNSGDDDKVAKKNSKGDKVISLHKEAMVAEVCFLSAFAFAMLHHGHGFDLDRNFTAVDTMDYGGATLSVGWQLGAILYEVNTLPYTYAPLPEQAAKEQAAEPLNEGSSFPAAAAAVASLGASLIAVAATIAVAEARSKKAPGNDPIGLAATRKETYMSVRLAV